MSLVVSRNQGVTFEDGEDRGRVIVSGEQTGGVYSLLEWIIAAGPMFTSPGERNYGVHLHGECEETFFIISGALEFFIDGEVICMNMGDFVRVPRGLRHGYQNVSGNPVEMLVGFYPAGFEALFVKYRTDQCTMPSPGFVEDATSNFSSRFELPAP